MLDAQEAPAGQMEVVLAPGDSGILLHEAVGHGLEADFNRKGTSNYSGKVGEDGRERALHGRRRRDAAPEPRHHQRRRRGQRAAQHDAHREGQARRLHARPPQREALQAPPSGNGRRESFACAPMPRMTNTILLAGPHDPEEILRSVKRGIYAKKFGGGQVDIANGDFVFSLTESYLVEDGKITAPLKGVNLIGNGPEVLRKVTMLGNDVEVSDGIWTCGKDGQSVPVGVGCPTMKIDDRSPSAGRGSGWKLVRVARRGAAPCDREGRDSGYLAPAPVPRCGCCVRARRGPRPAPREPGRRGGDAAPARRRRADARSVGRLRRRASTRRARAEACARWCSRPASGRISPRRRCGRPRKVPELARRRRSSRCRRGRSRASSRRAASTTSSSCRACPPSSTRASARSSGGGASSRPKSA